jgi:hypothetical protein
MAGIEIRVSDWAPAPFELPAAHTEFVIGDSHGMRHLLKAVLDRGTELAPRAHLTLLGDLIDRGPASLATLTLGTATVLDYREHRGGAAFLPGNHEQILVGAVADPASAAAGLLIRNGGLWATEICDTEAKLEPGLRRALGDRGYDILTQDGALLDPAGSNAILHRRIGNVILVHAGVDPRADDPEGWITSWNPLEFDDNHPLWIRDDFLEHKGAFPGGLAVVHGHTFEYRTVRGDTGHRCEPGEHRIDGWRLGLDGGSFSSGIVAGALLRNGEYRTIVAATTSERTTRDEPDNRSSLTCPADTGKTQGRNLY